MPRALRSLRPLFLGLLAASLAGCASWSVRSTHNPDGNVHAVLINGGGAPGANYQSHFLHIQDIVSILARAGIPNERIVLFNADGTDPEADMSMRESVEQPHPEAWRISGTAADARLYHRTKLANTEIAGVRTLPATKADLSAWFTSDAPKIPRGDTVLLYVTDHGDLNSENPDDNWIRLWGAKERLSVTELAALLDHLQPDVRVVLLMSQCFSGAFARLAAAREGLGDSLGNTCGYFASPADRPAYGCYPENRGKRNVGHSFRFLGHLSAGRSFPEAHRATLVDDDTPDVPNRTSDWFVSSILRQAARGAGREFEPFVDDLLAEAWRNKAEWEPEIRLLDRIGATYGYASPRSLAELAEPDARLRQLAEQMRNLSDAWKGSLGDSNRAEMKRLILDRKWKDRLQPDVIDKLDDAEREVLGNRLVEGLQHSTTRRPPIERRLQLLRANADRIGGVSYRMSVRLGVTERMRRILTEIAARVWLRDNNRREESRKLEALQECERFELPIPPTERQAALDPPQPFPRMDVDSADGTRSLPAWMGIRFGPVKPADRERLRLKEGAARLAAILPGSPAERAGFEPGDILLGPPGRPFESEGEVRWHTMLSKVGEPRSLVLLRDNTRITASITPAEFPVEWPSLPGPPEPDTEAPPLTLERYRGDEPSLDGQATLLFFWATWCFPCKAAVPDVLEFAQTTGTRVIAVTDEERATLDEFFGTQPEFPANVAIDRHRKTHLAYGVSGTPTFVLIDAQGRVRQVATGFNPERGLPFPTREKESPSGAAEKPE